MSVVFQTFACPRKKQFSYWKTGETAFGGVTTDARTFYVDNIKGPKAGAVATPEPTDAPAAPTRSAASVMSLYSEAYTAAATIANVPWDDSNFEEITAALIIAEVQECRSSQTWASGAPSKMF